MATADLAQRVRLARSAVDREAGEARAVGTAGTAAVQRVADLRAQIELHDRVAGILTRCGEERQETAQQQIEAFVTRGLRFIFDESLSFHIVQSTRAGQAQVDFVIRSDYGAQVVDTPVMDARGGGMAAVVGFMIQFVVLLLSPGARRVLFLDETFAHVSAEYRPRLAEFLRQVSDKAVQLVMVTHDGDYAEAADTRYQFSLSQAGHTVATQLAIEIPE